ncbi:hypothetical protein B0A55_03733 [Friedmanniomyces simplex]|uniref:Uncharacterized protein n=1 Tax=Friedmanniomyces simplex TaxID=329884 RepID=A0A4U0XH71_9PEZI|nr:hypothetical protein B0A55_03733 [Friedmanniomyces simplex]
MGAFGNEPTESLRKKQRVTSPPVAPKMPAMTAADDRISANAGHRSSRSASPRSTRSAASQSGELAKTRASGGNTEQSARRHVREQKKTTKQNKKTGTRAERIVGWNPEFFGDAAPKENVDLPKVVMSGAELPYPVPNHTQWAKVLLCPLGAGRKTEHIVAA